MGGRHHLLESINRWSSLGFPVENDSQQSPYLLSGATAAVLDDFRRTGFIAADMATEIEGNETHRSHLGRTGTGQQGSPSR